MDRESNFLLYYLCGFGVFLFFANCVVSSMSLVFFSVPYGLLGFIILATLTLTGLIFIVFDEFLLSKFSPYLGKVNKPFSILAFSLFYCFSFSVAVSLIFAFFASPIVAERLGISELRLIVGLLGMFWLTRFNIPLWPYLRINAALALLPILLALLQLTRFSSGAILHVTCVVAVVSYFCVRVVPGKGIEPKRSIWLVVMAGAIATIGFSGGQADNAAIALAGTILGYVLGGMLIHLPDLELGLKGQRLILGVEILGSEILGMGFSALLFADWIAHLIPFLKAHYPGLV